MNSILKVADREGGAAIQFPLEEDGSLLSFRLETYFQGSHGLRYRHVATNSIRGLKFVDGKFYPPDGGWPNIVHFCGGSSSNNSTSSSKLPSKRKAEAVLEDMVAEKFLRMDTKPIDLILLGLMQDTTEDHIRESFGKFGDLELVSVKRDQNGASKGFGFIRFADYDSQKTVMGSASHFYFVNGHWCEVKIPNSKIKSKADVLSHSSQYLEAKIFVGRCASDITPSDLRQYFSRYGEVTHVYVPPNRAKPYAFVTFKQHRVAQSLWGEDHTIKGHSVNVRPAEKADPRNEKTTTNAVKDKAVSPGGTAIENIPSTSPSTVASLPTAGPVVASLPTTSPIIRNSQLTGEVLAHIKDMLSADQICKYHQPCFYTNMLSNTKKLTLTSLVQILQSQGKLPQSLDESQSNQAQDQAQITGQGPCDGDAFAMD